MPSGPRILLDNACYHIIARSNRQQTIFYDDKDFCEYLIKVKKYKRRHRVRLYGFCLMPNHVHMLGEVEKKKNLSNFMHDLSRSYTEYFNNKYHTLGRLWQGRFKSKVIIRDRYLIDCINYIELNPIRANIARAPHEYRWSSYGKRGFREDEEGVLLNVLSL